MSTPTPSKSVLGKGLASLLPPIQPAKPAPQAPAATTLATSPSSTGNSPTGGAGAVAAGPVKPNFDPAETPGMNRDRHPGIALASIDDIKANEFQPRRDFDQTALEELAQSIRENGLIQPLIVRKNGDKYELIAGERRLRASKIAGLKTVPIVIRKSTDREALELAIVENIQREDLNPVDEGLAYFQLMQEFQLSQEELAKRMGKERATIANALRILKLSDFILSEIKKGALSRGHAKALLAVDDIAVREKFAKEILEKNFSVRQSEKMAQELKTPKSTGPIAIPKSSTTLGADAELLKLTRELTQRYMSKIEIKGSKKSGAIQIQYSSEAELVRIFSLLLGDRA